MRDIDAELVAKAKADPTAMQELLEHKRGLVLAVVNRYKGNSPGRDPDDLTQLGMIGLVRAVRTYDPSKGAFSTHATTLIRQEIWTESVRPEKRRHGAGLRTVSFPPGGAPNEDGDDRSLDTAPWLAGGHPEEDMDDFSEDFELDPFVAKRNGTPLKAPPPPRPTKADAKRRIISADLTPKQREVMLARLDGKKQRELGTQNAVSELERRALKRLNGGG